MSVCTEVTSDSSGDSPRQCGSKSGRNEGSNHRSKSPTFIVTDPDSDIETDAVPSAPRPRGTPIPGPSKPRIVEDDGEQDDQPSTNKEIPGKASTGNHPKTEKIPPGFFKNAGSSGNSFMYFNNAHNLQFGHNYYFGPNVPKSRGYDKYGDEPSPPEYEILMSSKKVVNDEHLDCVAANIAENWKDLGLHLQMKKAAIFRCEHDYQNDHRERVYQLLLEWKQGTGGPNQAPLLARLSSVLWQLRERDALDGLVKLEKDPRLNGQ